jgi:uncharacterized repeat protein (TIGR03806 family)
VNNAVDRWSVMTLRALGALLVLALAACGDGDGALTIVPPPVPGLDSRPSNTTCIAPERDPVTARVSAPRAFPNLSFAAPVAMVQAPGDDSRWFVAERAGRVRVFQNDEAAAGTQDFVDLRARIDGSGGAGLLGFAIHPKFASNGLAYVTYVARSAAGIRSVTAEFSSPDRGLTLDPGSGRILLSIETPSTARNGGGLAFGPDGFLYIGVGDGGDSGGGPQNPRSLLGKMLRIDVDRRAGGAPYASPAGNPFAGNAPCHENGTGSDPCPEIYALGFRDPQGWSFDRRSGRLWVADAGQHSFEEIDVVERGGSHAAALKRPVVKYERKRGAAIAGGYVYRGGRAPSLSGRYVFANFDGGLVAALAPDGSGGFAVEPLVPAGRMPAAANVPASVAAFGEALDGELFVHDETGGEVRRLEFITTNGSDPVPELLSATGCLNSASNGAPPLLSLIPYGLNAPFWSDGAEKERWLGLPDGARISVSEDGDWELPNGTVIVKHFRLGARLAETRLFMRHPDGGWAGYTYQWNDAQTDATRVRGGLVAPIEGQDWIFPSEADCMWCHNDSAGFSLGLETAQLNGDHVYPQTGRTSNQLATLNAIDVLSPPVAPGAPAYADPGDPAQALETRARSYLHVNCSICHRPEGPTPALMDLRNDTPLRLAGACDVPPTLGDLDIPDARIIAPGEPARSELLARMSRRDADGMPPLASRLPDTEGIALIRDWIESLTPASCR